MNCPACRGTLLTDEDAAAHVCPAKAEAAKRAAIRPTKDRLLADAAQCAKDFIVGWGGEVECIILLAPKGSNDIAFARYVTEPSRDERTQQLLRLLSDRVKTTQRRLTDLT